jgi:small-conductance mechanosensitive channel
MDHKVILQYFESYPLLKDLVYTLLIMTVFTIIKKIVSIRVREMKGLRKNEKSVIAKRINLGLNLAFLIFILITWFSHLQSVFVSLFAVLAAIVLATKELIMCFTGGLLVYLTRSFKQGDRIEIDGVRGYVIDRSLTSTKVLEIGPEKNSQQTTGTIISLPNSVYLTKNIKNESYFQGYSIHTFFFRYRKGKKLEDLEQFLIQTASNVSETYIDSAKKNISHFCDKEGLDIPSLEPRIKLSFDDKDNTMLMLKMPVKNSNVASVEQLLLRSYIEYYQESPEEQLSES